MALGAVTMVGSWPRQELAVTQTAKQNHASPTTHRAARPRPALQDHPRMTSRANTGVALSALYRYIPALDSLRSYRFGHFRADFIAGLTVATVAVPQAMAYALGRRGSAGIRTLHGHRHDRRRRDFRLLASTHQRAHQRHFDCRAQRGGNHSARRPPAGRHSAGISCRAAPGGHHPGQARGPDALHLAFGHRRLHFRRKPAAGAGPVEEPAGPAQHGPCSRLLSGALLGYHDARRLPALAHGRRSGSAPLRWLWR